MITARIIPTRADHMYWQRLRSLLKPVSPIVRSEHVMEPHLRPPSSQWTTMRVAWYTIPPSKHRQLFPWEGRHAAESIPACATSPPELAERCLRSRSTYPCNQPSWQGSSLLALQHVWLQPCSHCVKPPSEQVRNRFVNQVSKRTASRKALSRLPSRHDPILSAAHT